MKKGWFHCGRCGGLFQDDPEKPCPECEGNPVVDESEFAFVEAGRESLASLRPQPASAPSSGKDHRRSSGKSRGVAIFVTIWILFLGGVVALVNSMRSDQTIEALDDTTVVEQAEDSRFLQEAYEDSYPQIIGFLQAGVVETRAQFVNSPLEALGMMTRSADRAPILSAEDKPRMEFFERFESPDGPAMQSAWIMPGGERLEMVMVRDDEDSWKIDWPNLVRYSEEPWSLFLSGNGPEVGEFRVLARRRASSTGGVGDISRLMLLEPRPWNPGKTGLSSPEVQVDPTSEIGDQLKTAFAMREAGDEAFGTRLGEKDPKGMIRVTVVLRRSGEKDEHGEWGFQIEKLLACHWMSFDELGLPEEE